MLGVYVVVCLAYHTGTHACLSRIDGRDMFTTLFRPRILLHDDTVLFASTTNAYTRAAIVLESHSTGVILQHSDELKTNLFIFKCTGLNNSILACMWSPDAPRRECILALVKYHDVYFPSHTMRFDDAPWREISDNL